MNSEIKSNIVAKILRNNFILSRGILDYNKSFAIFDFDGTIVMPNGTSPFPKDVDDWTYTRKSVPFQIKEIAKTHQIIILTDQSKLWKIEMIRNVLDELDIDFFAIISLKKEYRKPNTKLFFQALHGYKKKETDFYVGDAAGRKTDWSSVDIDFAKNLGIKFIPADEYFQKDEIKETKIETNNQENNQENNLEYHKNIPEIIILVGLPGVGKTFFANKYFAPYDNYLVLDGDVYKTTIKLLKVASNELDKSDKIKSVVFTATNVTKEKRKEYIDFAKARKMSVRIFWLDSPLQKILERNKSRPNPVPKIAIYTANKRFQEPTLDEGAEIVKITIG
jgi:bifunctional polynucleotide phosphatase/kinase